MQFPGFIGGSYQSQSRIADAELAINIFPEVVESGRGKNVAALYPAPGLVRRVTLPTAPGRDIFYMDGRAFVISGEVLYEFFVDGAGVFTYVNRGVLATDRNPATISSNGDGGRQLFITTGGQGFIYDLDANTLTLALTSTTVLGDFLDGFFLALDPDQSRVNVSGLNAGLTWDPSVFFSRTAGADRWRALKVLDREIFLFGSQTSEVWYNAGNPQQPMAPVPGAFFHQGIAAPFSLAQLGKTLIWLGANEQGQGVVYRTQGYQGVRVSTHATENAWRSYSRIDDADAFAYQEDGHEFYVLNFPSADATWVYDITTNLWHQRGYWDTSVGRYTIGRPRYHALAFGRHLVCDRVTGAVLEQSLSLFTDADNAPLRWLRRCPHLSNENTLVHYPGLQLDMQVGITPVPAIGRDPQVVLRWSDDGGITFSNGYSKSAGPPGAYKQRVIWRQLGASRDRVFEVSGSDPIPYRLINAYLL